MARVEKSLQWCFATLTICCGLLLRDAVPFINLALIAIIVAPCSLAFVDRWKWFSLPPFVAYLCMLAVTAYCMWGFFGFGQGQQLSAVALLLVLVQAVLLFQPKTKRIYEQLTIFCLLQMIVGAVVNDALAFGVLLIPSTLLLLMALMLIQAWIPLDRRADGTGVRVEASTSDWGWPEVRRGLRRSVIAGWTGMILVAALFFYATPRSRGMQPRSSKNTSIGFNDQLTLNQLGTLAGNPQVAMRVSLTDTRTNKVYPLVDGAYLRGAVVDTYSRDAQDEAHWRTELNRFFNSRSSLPEESWLITATATRGDPVQVEIDSEMTPAVNLFSIAPYYADRSVGSKEIVHVRGRWLLERNTDTLSIESSQTSYRFLTRAFASGRTVPFLRPLARHEFSDLRGGERRTLLAFNSREMPSVVEVSDRIASELPPEARQPVEIANTLSEHLRTSLDFHYTQTISQVAPDGVDPIEDFVGSSRRGHCQYFASALAMMLRSQSIPSRLVIGYRMNEYNELGKYWVVRQQDAHAWVEAYFTDDQLPKDLRDPDSRRRAGVWMQFDPTPPVSRNASSQMVKAIDVANSMWREYVVEHDKSKQGDSFYGLFTSGKLTTQSLWERLQATVIRIRAGQFGEGQLNLDTLISWQAAFVAMGLGVVFYAGFLCAKLFWNWMRRNRSMVAKSRGRISVDFFATLMRILAKGKHRRPGQTPRMWVSQVVTDWQSRGYSLPSAAIESTVDFYYRAVYGGHRNLTVEERSTIQKSLEDVRTAVGRKRSR